MNSTDTLGSQKMFSMTQRNLGASLTSLMPKGESKRETPMIKLQKVEECDDMVNQPLSDTEEAKSSVKTPATAASIRSKKQSETNASVSEIFKQRIAQFRRTISKGMNFSD